MSTAKDPLLAYRDQFCTLSDSVFMISHSLGAQPKRTSEDLAVYLGAWEKQSISSWGGWLEEVNAAGGRIGKIIGAAPGSIMMLPNVSTTMAVLASCLDYSGKRNKIVYSALEFPSVSYVWQAEAKRGAEVVVVPGDERGLSAPAEALCAAIDERTLLVPISQVMFRCSFVADVQAVVKRAHEVGALVIADLYQGAGVLPVDVTALDVDFACGGSVKWLCGGPGAGYLYVKPALRDQFSPRITGWFGHAHPFAFEMPAQDYAQSMWRYLGGTPPIAPLFQAKAGAEILCDIIDKHTISAIREKSLRQTALVIARVDSEGYTLNSPREAERRGGTVVFDFARSREVADELCRRRFFCDHRPGVGIRMSPHFYSSDDECVLFMDEVARILRNL